MAASTSASNNGTTFNGEEVAAALKRAWTSELERSNNPKLAAADKPEHFKATGGPGGSAWGAAGSAWGSTKSTGPQASIADGQPFLTVFAKGVQQLNKPSSNKKP